MDYKQLIFPDNMPALAESSMKIIVDNLIAEDRLIPTYHIPLFMAAERLTTYLEATKVLRECGFSATGVRDGSAVTRPEVKVQRDALRDFLELCKEFGFTPASRGKIKEQPKKEESPLDLFAKDE